VSYGEAEMYLVVGRAVILGLIAVRVTPASPEVVGLSHANRKADYGGLASRKIMLRMKLSPGGYTSEVRVENSSGDEKFDASASRRCDARRHFRRCRYRWKI
jgi:hypothetical protein